MAERSPTAPRKHATIESVRRLLSRAGFRRLFFTRIVSQFGDGVFQLAAADLLLFENPGSNPAWTLTKLSAITLIPFSIVVPFVGVFIDRWDRRRILTITPLIRTALVALVPLVTAGSADRPLFYAVVLVVLSANRFFLATMSAVLPVLVDEDDLLVANSLATTGGSIANVIGLGVGASIAAVVGGVLAGMVGGAGFLAAAVLARGIRVGAAHPEGRVPLGAAIVRVLREMADGIRHVARSRRASFGFVSIAAMQLLIGVSVATTAVVYIVRLDLGVGAVSALLSVIAIGVFAGVVSVPAAARRIPEERLPAIGFLIGGVTTLFTAALLSRSGVTSGGDGEALARTGVIIGSVFAGMAFAFAKIPVDTMVQEALPDEFRGRAFASYDMLYNVARVAGTAAAAWFVAANVDEARIVVGVGVAYLVAAVWTLRASARLEGRHHATAFEHAAPVAPTAEPLFAGGEVVAVRAYEGSRAAEEPRAIVVEDYEVPIDRVDWRAVEQLGDRRRRIFAVEVAGQRVRLAYDEASDLWEIDRVIRGAENRPGGSEQ